MDLNILSLLVGFILGVVIIGLAVVSMTRLKERKLSRLTKQFQISTRELANREKEFYRSQKDMVEEERQRISRELHDDLVQRLSGIRQYLLTINYRHELPKEVTETINQLSEDLSESMQSIRPLIWLLAIPEIEGKSFNQAVESLCSRANKVFLNRVEFKLLLDHEKEIENSTKLILYRMIQEGIQNAARHANAWTIRVMINWDVDYLKITIDDDGEGMLTRKPGEGLKNMRERAAEIGAQFWVEDKETRGTRLRINLRV